MIWSLKKDYKSLTDLKSKLNDEYSYFELKLVFNEYGVKVINILFF